MTGADSVTGGWLDVQPGLSATALEDVLQDMVAGLTGLDINLIRPRWQPDPPKQPAPQVDWCALGVTGTAEEAAQLIQLGDTARLHTEDLVTVLLSFYGPNADGLAKAVRRGLHVPPNRAALRRASLALVEIGAETPAADFVAGGWIRRIDLPLTIRQGTPEDAGAVAIREIRKADTTIIGDTSHG